MTSRRAEYSRYHPNHGPALAPPSPTPTWTPAYLGVLVMVGANKKNFKPTVTAIMERYYAKYRGKGGLEEGEVAQGTSGGEGGGTQLGARAGSGRGGLIKRRARRVPSVVHCE